MKNKREILLRALRGDMESGVPWVPRMDTWYYANLYRDTLPEEFKKLDLKQIIRRELNILINIFLTSGYLADFRLLEAQK